MPARSRRLAEIVLFASALLAAASFGHQARGIRLELPLEVYPGATYLALLAWPAFLTGGDGAEDGPDLQLAAYSGPAYTMASTLDLVQPGGTDMRFDAIPWDGEPFTPPIYYGLRGMVWPGNGRQGLMADFTHIKAEARKETVVDQSGTRDGAPVPVQAKISDTLSKLEFTHGYNLLTLNLLRRAGAKAQTLVPYVGVGAGVAIPHVEVGRAGWPPKSRTSEYQITGPAVQVLGGIEWRFAPHFALFIEYKLSCAAIRGTIKGGGSVKTNLCTHQLLGGPAWHLKKHPAEATP